MDLAESGMRYTQMPHVMEVGYANFLIGFLLFLSFIRSTLLVGP